MFFWLFWLCSAFAAIAALPISIVTVIHQWRVTRAAPKTWPAHPLIIWSPVIAFFISMWVIAWGSENMDSAPLPSRLATSIFVLPLFALIFALSRILARRCPPTHLARAILTPTILVTLYLAVSYLELSTYSSGKGAVVLQTWLGAWTWLAIGLGIGLAYRAPLEQPSQP